MQTVFITGAEGFAGSHLLRHLAGRGFGVVAGVRNRARKLAHERQEQKALVCDITDAINVARVIASVRPDAIVHLAGMASPATAAAEPLEAYQSIVTSWANILDAVRRTVPRAKIVLASACDVYGGTTGETLLESTPANPTTTFGSLKLAAEALAHTFFRDYHLDVTIARPFHYIGTGQPRRFFFGAVAEQLAHWNETSHEAGLCLPDLSCERDLLHVDDVATAYEKLLTGGRPNETYNICSGQSIKCQAIVEMLIAEFGLRLTTSDLPTTTDGTQTHMLRGSNQKLLELGWQPTHSLQDAVQDLAQTYRTAIQPIGV